MGSFSRHNKLTHSKIIGAVQSETEGGVKPAIAKKLAAFEFDDDTPAHPVKPLRRAGGECSLCTHSSPLIGNAAGRLVGKAKFATIENILLKGSAQPK